MFLCETPCFLSVPLCLLVLYESLNATRFHIWKINTQQIQNPKSQMFIVRRCGRGLR